VIGIHPIELGLGELNLAGVSELLQLCTGDRENYLSKLQIARNGETALT
jgi:hypothetical protein